MQAKERANTKVYHISKKHWPVRDRALIEFRALFLLCEATVLSISRKKPRSPSRLSTQKDAKTLMIKTTAPRS